MGSQSPLSWETYATSALNFSGEFFWSPEKEGMGAVGLISVREMACDGSRAPMSVRCGPGPSLPFSPILCQARQPDWATTCLPFSYSASTAGPCALIRSGVLRSICVGAPALAPR